MSKLAELQSRAELPQWLEPLAEEIAGPIQADLRANTMALEQIQSQLKDLIEVQLSFLEQIQRQLGRSGS
jgi:hypothetical protein